MTRPMRIGMILYGDLTFDSRVRREARTLALSGYDVLLVCLADTSDRADLPSNVDVMVRPLRDPSVVPGSINPFRTAKRRRWARIVKGFTWLPRYARTLRSWGRAVVAECGSVDAWHANDLTALAAISPAVRTGTPIVYDVHDLVLETGTAIHLPRVARWLLRAYERRLVRHVAGIVTVNDGLATVLRRDFPGKRLAVVHNCPGRWVPATAPMDRLRLGAGIAGGEPLILYHGSLTTGRGIEPLMDALLEPGLESAHLVLLGFGERRDVFAAMTRRPPFAGRVHVLDPVPPDELLSWVASADIGAVLHPGERVNDYLKTPNKLFECIAAGVPVVASDFPLIRQIVLDDPAGPLGATADPSNPVAIATALRSILELDAAGTERLRSRCHVAAVERWNWETESSRLLQLYAVVLAPSGPGRDELVPDDQEAK